eukprot:2434695-Pyramimonas_sp.AAC.1
MECCAGGAGDRARNAPRARRHSLKNWRLVATMHEPTRRSDRQTVWRETSNSVTTPKSAAAMLERFRRTPIAMVEVQLNCCEPVFEMTSGSPTPPSRTATRASWRLITACWRTSRARNALTARWA